MAETVGLVALTAAGVGTAGEFGVAIGAPLIFGVSTATIVGTTILLGATVGISLYLQSQQKKPVDNPEVTIKQPLPARFIDIGRVKTGGALFFLDTAVPVAGTITLVVAKILSCCPIQEVESFKLDDKIPSFTGSPFNGSIGVVNNDTWASNIQIESNKGSFTQNVSSLLSTRFPSAFTSDHRNRGLAYAVVEYFQTGSVETFSAKYPANKAPELTAIIKGAMLPDPRLGHNLEDQSTWTYSDNSALAVLRFLCDRDGWDISEHINVASFITAANDCDDLLSGAKRYRSWGRYYTNQERRRTLEDLLAACDGRLFEQPDGTVALFVGKYKTPTVTIETKDVISADLEPFGDTLDRVGSVKARIRDETQDWQEVDVAYVELDVIDDDTAIKNLDLPLAFVPTAAQANRLAGATLNRLNPRWRGTITTTLTGLQAHGERFIQFIFDPLGIIQTFEVESVGLNTNMTVQLTIRSVETGEWG